MRSAHRVSLDTEADSLHHYYEKVCLIQVSFDGIHAAIDPLAGLDLSAFLRALAGKPLVVHGGDYDFRMLRQSHNFTPHKDVFDTVLAAQLLGYAQYGLPALAERLLGVSLSKSGQKSDWARRPLTPAQLTYALDDVRHLESIATRLEQELETLGRTHWHREGCSRMVASSVAPARRKAEESWRIKGLGRRTPHQMAFVRALWHWREREAQRADRPPFRIMGNHVLLELALWAAAHPCGRLEQGPALPRSCRGHRLRTLHQAIDRARRLPPERWPQPRTGLPRGQEDPQVRVLVDALAGGRDAIANELGLVPATIAPKAALVAIARQRPATTAEILTCTSLLRWQARLLKPIVRRVLRDQPPEGGRS